MVAFGPNKNPMGFIMNRFAFPKPVVWIVPKMFEMFPPVTRPKMFDVARPELLRKFAILLLGTLKSPKLCNRFPPPPGLVPPVMSYWTLPEGRLAGGLTCVLSPEGVMGEAAWTSEVRYGTDRASEQPSRSQEITLACSASRLFNGAPP